MKAEPFLIEYDGEEVTGGHTYLIIATDVEDALSVFKAAEWGSLRSLYRVTVMSNPLIISDKVKEQIVDREG